MLISAVDQFNDRVLLFFEQHDLPRTNGIRERFHKTILQDFYQLTFHKKIYADVESLQVYLDEWLMNYNNERTHQVKSVVAEHQ